MCTAPSQKRRSRVLEFAVTSLVLICAAPAAVAAQGFSVGPVRIAMTADQPSASVEVRSGSFTSSVLVQATAFTWTEVDGEREMIPTDELVVSPAVFKLGPGGVRTLLLNAPTTGPVPRYYRLRVEEVADEAAEADPTMQIEMLRAFDLPVFVEASGAAAELRTETAIDASSGEARIRLHNDGNGYAIATGARVLSGESVVSEITGLYYVLPGESREIVVAVTDVATTATDLDGNDESAAFDLSSQGLSELTFELLGGQGEVLTAGTFGSSSTSSR